MNLGHTCGPQCWTAKDDVCHCSCGGANHGCLRTEGGVQPIRSRKINGRFYELHSVHRGYGELMKLRQEKDWPLGTITKTATSSEVDRWPELTAFRNQSPVDRILQPPVCVWKISDKYK
ncbi:hypothetical protein [Caudoviricetes sp.]|nr:hypothetical protein [Caudoviricetes sp.]